MISKVLIAGGALASGAVAERPSLRKLAVEDEIEGSVTVELSKMVSNLSVTQLETSHALTNAVLDAVKSYASKGSDAESHLQDVIAADGTLSIELHGDAGEKVTVQGNKITFNYNLSGFGDSAAAAHVAAFKTIKAALASDASDDLSVKIAELADISTGLDDYEFARGFITPPAADLAGSVTLTFEEMPANLLPALLEGSGTHHGVGEKIATAIQKYADKESEGGALQGSFAFADLTGVTYSVNGNDITIGFTLGGFAANTALDADKSDAYRTIRAAVSTAEEDHMAQHAFANSVACQLVSELADEDDWSVVCEEESSPTEKTSGSARVAVVSFAAAAVAGAALF